MLILSLVRPTASSEPTCIPVLSLIQSDALLHLKDVRACLATDIQGALIGRRRVDSTRVWNGDESYEFQPGKCRFFFGMTRPLGDPDEARAGLRDLVLRRDGYLHFYEEQPTRRLELARATRDLEFDMMIVSWEGELAVAQARSRCVKAAARALEGTASGLVLESRGPKPDARDVRVLSRLYPPEHRIPVRFVGKRSEPLTWASDILAGAAFQAHVRGSDQYLNALGPTRWVDAR
jgi:hypothetical protein